MKNKIVKKIGILGINLICWAFLFNMVRAGGNDQYTVLLIHGEEIVTSGNPWPYFLESSQAGNGGAHHNVLIVNGALKTVGKFGEAFNFDGSNDYLEIADHANLDLGNGLFTIDWWEYQSSDGIIDACTFEKSSQDVNFPSYLLQRDNLGGNPFFYYSSNGNMFGFSIGISSISAWNHWAIMYDGSRFYAYKNGVVIQNIPYTFSFTDTDSRFMVGNGRSNKYFKGLIDEFRISKGVARNQDPTDPLYDPDFNGFVPPTTPYTSIVPVNLNVEFENATGLGSESTGSVVPRVFVKGGVITESKTIEVALSNAQTTATLSSDFNFASPLILTIGAGDYTNGQFLNVMGLSVLEDALVEGNENIQLVLQNPSTNVSIADADGLNGIENTFTYTINDNDSLKVEFLDSIGNWSENVGAKGLSLKVQGGRPPTDQTIKIVYQSGTASLNTDFTLLQNPLTVTIPVADYSNGVILSMVNFFMIVNDNLLESVPESLVFGLENPSAALTIGDADNSGAVEATHTFVINDDDIDSDNDGVSNGQETIDGTNPNNSFSYKDTDGDLVPDWIEEQNGTSKNNAADFRDTDTGGGDGVPDYIETRGFNGGDGNGDGVADATQRNVAQMRNLVTNSYTTLEAQSGCVIVKDLDIRSESQLSKQDDGYNYPVGLVDFKLQCSVAGTSAGINLYYTQNYNIANWIFRKFNRSTQTYSNLNVVYSTVNLAGTVVTKVYYTVKDGDLAADQDRLVNGYVEDPAGPGEVVSKNMTLKVRLRYLSSKIRSANTKVKLLKKNKKTLKESKTDKKGGVEFTNLELETYYLSVAKRKMISKLEYLEQRKSFQAKYSKTMGVRWLDKFNMKYGYDKTKKAYFVKYRAFKKVSKNKLTSLQQSGDRVSLWLK